MNDDRSSPLIPSPRQQVLEAASAMVRGELGIIEGSRLLGNLRSRVTARDHDPDFLPFVAIESETDHLPVGDVRKYWAADALARVEQEIQTAEAFYRDQAIDACERLLVRFRSGADDDRHISRER